MYARACDFPFWTHGKRPYFSGSAAASQFKDFKDSNLFLEPFQIFKFFSKFNNFPGFLKTVKTLFKRKGSTSVLLIIKTDLTSKFSQSLMI